MSSIRALLAEREGYRRHGLSDRVALVDAELAKSGVVVDDDAPDLPDEVEIAVPGADEVERAVMPKRRGRGLRG